MDVTYDRLAALVGDDLEFTAAGGITATLRVAAAEPNPPDVPGGSVELHGPLTPALGQGTYPIRHAEHGSGLLFIVPIAQDEDARTYQAVFG